MVEDESLIAGAQGSSKEGERAVDGCVGALDDGGSACPDRCVHLERFELPEHDARPHTQCRTFFLFGNGCYVDVTEVAG